MSACYLQIPIAAQVWVNTSDLTRPFPAWSQAPTSYQCMDSLQLSSCPLPWFCYRAVGITSTFFVTCLQLIPKQRRANGSSLGSQCQRIGAVSLAGISLPVRGSVPASLALTLLEDCGTLHVDSQFPKCTLQMPFCHTCVISILLWETLSPHSTGRAF